MPKYIVQEFRLTAVFGEVDAADEKEAIEKAWRGEWDASGRWPDIEPAGNTRKKSWTAEPAKGTNHG